MTKKQTPPLCMFCGGSPMTREHVFRSAWKDKLDVTIFPAGSPLAERKITRYRLDNNCSVLNGPAAVR